MAPRVSAPGLAYATVVRANDPSPLRSDVAGFLGPTRRGPVATPVRVEAWRAYLERFGGLRSDADTPYGIRGYFNNAGQVAHVIRVCGPAAQTASAIWTVGELDAVTHEWKPSAPARGGFSAASFVVRAADPGAWARGTRVVFSYRLTGPSGQPEIDVTVRAPGEPDEIFLGLSPATIDVELAAASRLVRLTPQPPTPLLLPATPAGPRALVWDIELSGGADDPPRLVDYLAAADALGDVGEVALVSAPDLHRDLVDDDDRRAVLEALITRADALHDRLVLVDVPPESQDPLPALAWIAALRNQVADSARAAAAYHPRLLVPDPLGGIDSPLRTVPPSGHIAGVISLSDRTRGAHYTPANAVIAEAVDIVAEYPDAEQVMLNEGGVDLLRCFAGRGLLVWGGRTLDLDPDTRFVAHRRLIHRLVRAIRRVAEPLVFDVNGPELWLALVRGISSVLLAAFRAGGLKGARPEDAFRVRCDDTTNPPAQRDVGQCVCEIELAPAVPMEFILLRVALSRDGTLDATEAIA